jgi:hypothetical protein
MNFILFKNPSILFLFFQFFFLNLFVKNHVVDVLNFGIYLKSYFIYIVNYIPISSFSFFLSPLCSHMISNTPSLFISHLKIIFCLFDVHVGGYRERGYVVEIISTILHSIKILLKFWHLKKYILSFLLF